MIQVENYEISKFPDGTPLIKRLEHRDAGNLFLTWQFESMEDLYDTVYGTNFGRFIIDYVPKSITLIGLCTDICVISNAMMLKSALHEIPIIVDASCCAGVTPESHKTALAAMKACQIEIVNE